MDIALHDQEKGSGGLPVPLWGADGGAGEGVSAGEGRPGAGIGRRLSGSDDTQRRVKIYGQTKKIHRKLSGL